MNKSDLTYKEYYLRVIREGCNGFKPVLGGTGLGKTYGLIEAVKANEDDRKYIYVAHRKNLLQEMCDSLCKNGVEHILLQSDEDQLRTIFNKDEFKQELRRFLNHHIVKRHVDTLEKKGKGGTYNHKKAKNSFTELPNLLSVADRNSTVDIQDKIDLNVSNIYQFVKRILIETKRAEKNDYNLITIDFQELFDQLFPFMPFKREHKNKVLVLTFHKIFHGLFSGEKTLRINNFKGFIIFLDEYDFLEPILLDKICEEVPLEDPFLMLNYFKSNVESKLKKESYPEGEHHGEIRDHLCSRIKQLKKLNARYAFPEVRYFVTNDDSLFGNWIFLTNQTIVEKPVYIQVDKDKATYNVTSNSKGNNVEDAFPLLRTVLSISSSIMRSFAGWKDRNNEVFEEILHDSLGHTEFQRIIRRVPFYHSLRKPDKNFINNYNYLLDRGMGVLSLRKPNDTTEPEEVKIDYYNVPISPERILLSLIRKNMVFGLSATAKLNRIINHFDESWFKDQIEKLSDNNIRYFEDDDFDKCIVQTLTQQKREKRKNTVLVQELPYEISKTIKKEIEELENREDGQYGIRNNGGFDKARVTSFYRMIDWIYRKLKEGTSIKELKSHLVFYNSLRQLDFYLNYRCENSNNADFKNILKVERKASSGLTRFEVTYKNQLMHVVFLEKKAYESIYPSGYNHSSETLKLFWDDAPVIFLTTYPSAANGVNLQYYPTKEQQNKEDFRCIHLLEGPHFYFSSKYAEHGRVFTERKKDLWKVTKLHLNDPISSENHKNWINTILRKDEKKRATMNTLYKKFPDFLHNQMATYFQALGRMERIREAEVGTQYVMLSCKIMEEFSDFLYLPQYETIRTECSPYYSDFLSQVVSQIKRSEKEQESRKNEKKEQVEARSKEDIDSALQDIGQIQRKQMARERATNFINYWHEMRGAALRHEFNHDLIKSNHIVYLNKEDSALKKERFNRIYELIKDVPEINLHFRNNGFSLERTNIRNGKWFTDCFAQQILLGAIGEEVVRVYFQSKKVEVRTPEDKERSLFEVADFYLPEHNIFVDAKNFTKKSILNYRSDDEINWTNPSEIRKKVSEKLRKIRQSAPEARLIIMNVYYSESALPKFIKLSGKIVSEGDDWDIGFVPNVIVGNGEKWAFIPDFLLFGKT